MSRKERLKSVSLKCSLAVLERMWHNWLWARAITIQSAIIPFWKDCTHTPNKFQMSALVEEGIISLTRLVGLEIIIATRIVLNEITKWRIAWLCPHREPQTAMEDNLWEFPRTLWGKRQRLEGSLSDSGGWGLEAPVCWAGNSLFLRVKPWGAPMKFASFCDS